MFVEPDQFVKLSTLFVNDCWFVFRNSLFLIKYLVNRGMLIAMLSDAAGKRWIITSAVHKQHGVFRFHLNHGWFLYRCRYTCACI